jgi:diguanylate cyclase (GGDEF)-like protein
MGRAVAYVVGGILAGVESPVLYGPGAWPWDVLFVVDLIGFGLVLLWRRTVSGPVWTAQTAVVLVLIGLNGAHAADGRIAIGVAAVLGVVTLHTAMLTPPYPSLALTGLALVESLVLVRGSGLTGASLLIADGLIGTLTVMPTLTVLGYRRDLESALAGIQHAATTDTLTELANRRGLAERAPSVFSQVARSDGLVGVLLADIDHFKGYNDTFGHLRGDQALYAVSRLVCSSVRPTDVVARFGGEELCVVAVLAGERQLAELAERIRKAVEHGGAGVTVSVGATAHRPPPDGDVGEQLWRMIDDADALLYEAKQAGRNVVRVASRPPAG